MSAGQEAAERLEARGRRRLVAALRQFAEWEVRRLPRVAHTASTNLMVLVQPLDSLVPKGLSRPAREG